ncbi:MAG TPA: nucleotide sugar dehydrogenase [Ktedonobacteraceae bacterium]|nr:nucleotide sugar dehydrogenase [Ktedonobacteraceae bacterium]
MSITNEDVNAISKDAVVVVVGLGKIGLPLAVQYAQHGHRVIGCDTNPQVVSAVNKGKSHILEEPLLEEGVADVVACGLLSATSDTAEAVRQARIVVVIVPVAVNARHEIVFDNIDRATEAIGAGLQPGTLVIYETTLPVGATSGRLARQLERHSRLTAGRDFLLAFSPERVSSGSIFRDLRLYPKVVGGIDKRSTVAAVAFYRSVLDAEIITMASADDAEFVKLIETTYRDVNIALANELAHYADAHGLDTMAAIAAANSQPYSHIHTPGVGVGGHCIPVYPYFLLAGDLPQPVLTLPRSARAINDAMAEYAVQRVEAITGSLAGRAVLMLGVSYRGDVRETAFTSARLLQDALLAHGASVYVDDPLFEEAELRAEGYIPYGRDKSGPYGCDKSGSHETREEICAIILQANHRAYQSFDFSQFPHCKVVLDGRMALDRQKIEALGMRYVCIGRPDMDGQVVQGGEK